ncbi:DUF7669 domain-containing protein [Knoellia aerolata]|uniref:DUF7669 domain-containing protein n=1 Tax=Knoellia aerolata TaxID=442954 RepID=UPI0012EDF7B8|nr:hypothetical protein [Knoellia aerolata]
MTVGEETIWARLDECVQSLTEPFTAAEIMSWFRRHYPDVKETSLRAHIQSANSTSPDRGTLGYRSPLITRIQHGVYVRATDDRQRAPAPPASTDRGSNRLVASVPPTSPTPATPDEPEWHTEARVQAMVVTHLATHGWQILSVADTASRAHGTDIVANKGSERIGVEVKGFPSKRYADPARAQEKKPTQPSTQARTWYANALLSALRLKSRQPSLTAVMAFPEFVTYRSLYADTKPCLDQIGVKVWWVSEDGAVTADE